LRQCGLHPQAPDAVHAVLPLVPKEGSKKLDHPGIGRALPSLSVGCVTQFLELLPLVLESASPAVKPGMKDPESLDAPVLVAEADMTEGSLHAIAQGHAMAFSRKAPGRTGPNEDCAALIPLGDDAAVLAVADGVGGAPSGGDAARLALKKLVAAVRESGERANEAVIDLGVGAGTTLVAIAIEDRLVRPFHVGDSEALVVGQRGRVKLATPSHSPVGYAVHAGYLDAREAMHHEDRHLLLNVIGSADMRIEIGARVQLAARDTIVLGSDGLFDNMHLNEIVERTRKGPLAKVVESLARKCADRMEQPREGQPSKVDDVTFVVFRLGVAKRRRGQGSRAETV
jgi:serine/threonine protein phosphatase PrpC